MPISPEPTIETSLFSEFLTLTASVTIDKKFIGTAVSIGNGVFLTAAHNLVGSSEWLVHLRDELATCFKKS